MRKQLNRLLCAICAALVCSLSVHAAPQMLIPGGGTVGIKLNTRGLVVTGFEENSPAKDAGVKKGDVIMQVDGQVIHTADTLRGCVDKEEVILTVLRDGKTAQVCVTPRTGQLGAYVRDSVAGIGTVTYYDPMTSRFGALGHGVNDVHSSALIPVREGAVVASSVTEVKKGTAGHPGELKGTFDTHTVLGKVEENDKHGIFGVFRDPVREKPLPVGTAETVKEGKATIRSNIAGTEIKEYDVWILKINPLANDTGRNLLLKVTDKELLQTTGGIVQGMSGSPIIQDGKLVGAVTHVLVNDPTRGYGIFIENMLDAAG